MLRSLEAALASTPPDPEVGIAALRALLAAGIVTEFLNERLRALADGPSPAPPSGQATRIRIIRTPGLRLDATVVSPDAAERATVEVVTRHTLVANAGTAPLRVRRFRQPNPEPHDVFDPARRLERLDDLVLPPGDVSVFGACCDAYELRADAPALAVTAAGPHQTSLRWFHDVRSLRPVRATPTDEGWLRIRELLRLAEVMGDASVVPTLRGLRDHPSHFVRWSAAQSVLRISRPDGIAWLREAAHDPHPQVRSAARGLLASEDAAWR